jgi:hypothetical protein
LNWSYKEAILPKEFHTENGCNNLMKWIIKHGLKSLPGTKVPYGRMEDVVLAIGSAMRDITMVIFQVEEDPDEVDPRIQQSVLNSKHFKKFVSICERICANDLYVNDVL